MADTKTHPDSPQAQAEDVAYTINHALACTATDFIDPYFGNITQRYLGRRFSIGCGHDHSHDHHHHGHAHHDHAHHGSNLKHWWVGEIAGDFGAVPVTIAIQRTFPAFMNSIRSGMEPVFGRYFHAGAARSARKWAKEQGFSADSKECTERTELIYRHEIQHLPQALLWTASSVTINLATQKLMGNKGPLWQLAAGKAVGASISASLVMGARGAAPGAARSWDQFTSENVFLPGTRVIGTLFGLKEQAVDTLADEQQQLHGAWEDRITQWQATDKQKKSI